MKAVILAGGEGTRLRPLTCARPKPMIPLLGVSVMEHMIKRLVSQGICDIAVTLCYLPEAIRSHFGDGSAYGARITYYIEDVPLGTAGCIAACKDFIDDTTLIVSGDGVCEFDFREFLRKHENSGAEASILLTSHPSPLDYGLVITDGRGKIQRFIEKPSWNSVCTDRVNTGIYIIEPSLLFRFPQGKCDFAKDIFPAMLREGAALYGFYMPGYWCDIGDCGAYLDCVRAMLEKSKSPAIAERAAEPVYIEEGAYIDKNAKIGPYVYVGKNAVIEGGAEVSNSSVEGYIGANARIDGAIIGENTSIGAGTVCESGVVIGENVTVGKGCTICGGVRIWPGHSISDGERVRYTLTGGNDERIAVSDGIIRAPYGAMSHELCLSLGTAAVKSGRRIGISMEAGSSAELYFDAFVTGVCSGGGDTVEFYSALASQCAYACKKLRLDLCVFMEYTSALTIRLFDARGLPLDGGKIRNILFDARRGSFERAAEPERGRRMKMRSLTDSYIRAADYGSLHGEHFTVSMVGESGVLCNILWVRGARILPPGSGCPAFALKDSGFALEACDEDGKWLSDAKTLACAVYIAAHSGISPAVPFSAPACFAQIAAGAGMHLKRAYEDEDGEKMWAEQIYLRDGIHRALYIAAYLKKSGMKLSQLAEKIPSFEQKDKIIPLESGRSEFMRLASHMMEPCFYGRGIRMRYGGGWAVIEPLSERSGVRVFAESFSDESAQELCEGLCERLSLLDSALKRRKNGEGLDLNV